MIPRIKPAVAMPEAFPYTIMDIFLPLLPRMIATIPHAKRIKFKTGVQQRTIEQMPTTKEVIENARPS